jgi:hypothetical protein
MNSIGYAAVPAGENISVIPTMDWPPVSSPANTARPPMPTEILRVGPG